MTERLNFDGVLIIGAGLAGFTAALAAAPRRVLVLSAGAPGQGCASYWAQGGVAAALAPDDDPGLHAADTIAAGDGLCDPRAVEVLTREGPDAVRALAALGAPFDRLKGGGFAQSLEAAHSRARVARVGGDGAGRAIMQAVLTAAEAVDMIEIRPQARARGLLKDVTGAVRGALVETRGRLVEIRAAATILATGGLGGLYAVTTNPPAALGEGLALAALAGAQIVDPEFVQFHPTAIDIGADPAPLATEALRGEGARLINAVGEAFMSRYDPAGDLAARDVVARAIETERRAGGGVWLDAREAIGPAFVREFPAAFAACMAGGVDPRIQPIPVTAAAHYHMGGVGTDLWGRTSLEGLYAVGECASAGVHGANRLASNSLLEAAVFGRRAGEAAREGRIAKAPFVPAVGAPDLPRSALAALRAEMTAGAGVVRSRDTLQRLIGFIEDTRRRHGDALPLVAAHLVARAALERRESRGGHFRTDFPRMAREAVRTRTRLGPDRQARDRAA